MIMFQYMPGMSHLLISCGSCHDELRTTTFYEPPHDITHHRSLAGGSRRRTRAVALFWPYNDVQYRRLLRVIDGYFKGIWSLLKRSMANFAAADQAGLVRIIKRKLKRSSTGPT
jgi:hypothetical protein